MKKLLIETNKANILGKSIYTIGLGLMVVLILSHCTGVPTTPTETSPKVITDTLDSRYISDKATGEACWFSNGGKDSLIIGTKRYVISTRSRYRSFEEPVDFGDTIAEGPVLIVDPIIFLHDTKTNLNFVFNSCQGG